MLGIIDVQCLHDYVLFLKFNDGVEGEVDMADYISFEGVFAQFKDMSFFNKVKINRKWGAIEWPGGIMLDTEALYEEVTGIQLVGKDEIVI